MIRLIMRDGTAYWLNPDKLVEVYTEATGATLVRTTQGETVVTESPEQVAQKVLEYKMNMAKSSAAYMLSMQDEERLAASQEFNWVERDLHKLAGLEDDHE